MSPIRPVAAALAVALALPAAAFAHHGWSSYDEAKTLKFTAPLAQVSWGNPHSMAKVEYQGRQWDVYLAPVNRMETRGLTRAMLTTGEPVTLEGYARRDGVAEMRLERITVDGKTVELR